MTASFRGELAEHFAADVPDEAPPASWASRAAAGGLLLGARPFLCKARAALI